LSLGGSTVLREITELGYSAEWRVISAASVGAAHRRDRIIIVAYPDGEGLERPVREVYQGTREGLTRGGWEWWQVEPGLDRVANGVPRRVDRIKCLGNAVVPQVAEVIGQLVRSHANDY
jgi:DNA (cytosine-5)-methyltransferase 1